MRYNVNSKKDPKRKNMFYNNNHGVAGARPNVFCSPQYLQPVSGPREVQPRDGRKILKTTKYLTIIVCTQSQARERGV